MSTRPSSKESAFVTSILSEADIELPVDQPAHETSDGRRQRQSCSAHQSHSVIAHAVVACNAVGESTTIFRAPTLSAATAPHSISVQTRSVASVTLQWQVRDVDACEVVNGCKVKQDDGIVADGRQSNGVWYAIVPNLDASQTYNFEIVACNAAGKRATSFSTSHSTPPALQGPMLRGMASSWPLGGNQTSSGT